MKLYVNCITSGAGLRRDIKELIPEMNLRRRMSRVVKSGVAAGIESLLEFGDRAAVEAVVTATGLGCIADSEKFLDSLIANEERMLNPTPFIQSTFNTVGAQIALLDGDTYLNAAAPAPASTRVLSHTASENKFARLQPDKTDMTTPALEDAARTAAAGDVVPLLGFLGQGEEALERAVGRVDVGLRDAVVADAREPPLAIGRAQLGHEHAAGDRLPDPAAGRHAAAQRQTERLVLRIDRVDRAQLRRQRGACWSRLQRRLCPAPR